MTKATTECKDVSSEEFFAAVELMKPYISSLIHGQSTADFNFSNLESNDEPIDDDILL